MTVHVRDVVRQSSQGEGVVIDVSRFLEKRLDEITAPDVVSKMAEEAASERVVTHVLDDTARVRIRVGTTQLLEGRVGKAFKQKRLDLVIPLGVNDRFIRQHRVPQGWAGNAQCRRRDKGGTG